jgi:hypothetical protein
VIVASVSLFGVADHFAIFAFQSIRPDVTGGKISISYVLSIYTITLHGTLTLPYILATSAVLSLNSLINQPMLIPFCQSIGPKGGFGLASAAGTITVNCFAIFLAAIGIHYIINNTCKYKNLIW